jgi:nucleotidyltransferase/DNA polymerase involved in DNA repair
MDAFFVSVSSRNRPELVGKPVVISHGGARGTCASVNYVARGLGVHNGWRLAEAERLCGENLVVLPYDFEAYEKVSKMMYEVFMKYTKHIQVLSCDEALLDLTDASDQNYDSALTIAARIRDEVKIKTQCECSAGIGNSRTLASLALRQAKPNGCVAAPRLLDPASSDYQYMQKMVSVGLQPNALASDLERALGGLNTNLVSRSKLLSWLSTFKISHMKGIGPAIEDKLEEMGVVKIGQLQLCSLVCFRRFCFIQLLANAEFAEFIAANFRRKARDQAVPLSSRHG